MKYSKIIFAILVSTIWVLTSSCDPNRVFEDHIDIPEFNWDVKNKIQFEVDITDTTSLHNLYVNVRHASHYQYANLFVFLTINFPNGKVAKDTLECVLADEAGQWMGEGMGDIWDNQILWKPNIKFPIAGKYLFEYEQAMRAEQVQFVMDMGLRIEKAEMESE